MSKILRYDNRKQDALYWDVSTQERQMGAFLSLFRHLNKDWKVYEGLKQSDPDSIPLYKSAKDGNAMAAKLLLTRRNGYEYETWQVEDVGEVDIDKIKGGWFDQKKEHEYTLEKEDAFDQKKHDKVWEEEGQQLSFEASCYGPSVIKDVAEFFFDVAKFKSPNQASDRDNALERLEGAKIAGQRAQRNLEEVIIIINKFIRQASTPKTYKYKRY